MNGSSSLSFSEPYQGTIMCDIIELKDLSKKGLKKIYTVTKLRGNGKHDMAKTSCSFSEINGRFIPKDRRSETIFENITINVGLQVAIDVIIKQTLGKKTIGSATLDIMEMLQCTDMNKEVHCVIKPAGECLVRCHITVPHQLKATDDMNTEIDVESHINILLSNSDKKPVSIVSSCGEEKDADSDVRSHLSPQQSPQPHSETLPTPPKAKPPSPPPPPPVSNTTISSHPLRVEHNGTSSLDAQVDTSSSPRKIAPPPTPSPPPCRPVSPLPPPSPPLAAKNMISTKDNSPEKLDEPVCPAPVDASDCGAVSSSPLPSLPGRHSTGGIVEDLANQPRQRRVPLLGKSTSERHMDADRHPKIIEESDQQGAPPRGGIRKCTSERRIMDKLLSADSSPSTEPLDRLLEENEASPQIETLSENHKPFPAMRHSTGSVDMRHNSREVLTTSLSRQGSWSRQAPVRRQDSLKRQLSGRGKVDDGVHATASTSSRVSRELIRKLSDSRLLPAETEHTDTSGGKDAKPSVQQAALSWLEQQVGQHGDTTSPVTAMRNPSSRSETAPMSRSTPDSLSPADANTRRSTRALFMPAHSTIQEEADNDTLVARESKDGERNYITPNKSVRRRLSSTSNTSSVSIDSLQSGGNIDDGAAALPLDQGPTRNAAVRGRRSSISTTIARAQFDDTGPSAPSGAVQPDDERHLSQGQEGRDLDREEGAEDAEGGEGEGQEEDSTEAFTPDPDSMWTKRRGSGIRASRSSGRRRSMGGRKSRSTLTTVQSVPQWDDTPSEAEEARGGVHERSALGSLLVEEFGDAGTSPGMECWIVDSGDVRRIDEDDIGTFYDADCYILLHTTEIKKASRTYLTQAVHTWVGSRAQKDKVTTVAYKAHQLCKYLGENVPLTSNIEDGESDGFIEMLFGNINVMKGSIAQSSVKTVPGSEKEDTVRLLEVTAAASNSVLSMLGGSAVPYMQSIALDRGSLKSNSALILDTGRDIIYQWRGAQASHVSRARVFEAAFSLRSERIKHFPNCKIDVVDEGSEPDNFWKVFDAHAVKPKRRHSTTSTDSMVSVAASSGAGSEGTEKEEYSSDDDGSSSEMDQGSDVSFESEDPHTFVDDHGDDDDDFIYDMDEIKEYCAEQIEGHTEMQRRQVASKSRVLNPEALGIDETQIDTYFPEDIYSTVDVETLRTQVSLYRIGYVDGKLQTSRLCGVNSAGEDFGLPHKDLLDTKGVYILDFNNEVYVWLGRSSDDELRKAGATIATALVEHSKAEWVEAVAVLEGEESILFKTKFPGWYEAEMKQHATRRASWFQQRAALSPLKRGTPLATDESVRKLMGHARRKRHRRGARHSAGRKLCRSSVLAYERQPLDDLLDQDDGKGVTVIWKIVNAELRSVPRHEHGHFWTHESYVILYGFTLPKVSRKEDGTGSREEDGTANMEDGTGSREEGGTANMEDGTGSKEEGGTANMEDGTGSSDDESQDNAPQFVQYFWQGPHSKEKAYPQWKLGILPGKITEWTDQMGYIPPEIRIYQGRETPHFFRIFKHRYVVHIPFVGIVKQRHRSEEKVRQVQTEILRREKLRWNMLPVPRRNHLMRSGVSSPSSSRSLLSAARSSSRHSLSDNPRNSLSRNNSFSSIDSSVVDDISTHASPLPKASYQMETTAGVMLFHIRGLGICNEDVHAVQIEARASRLNSSDCFVCVRPYVSGKTFIWLWVGRGSQFFEQEAAGSIALMIKNWVDENSSRNQVRVVEEGAGEWFNKWIAKSFYKALGGFDLYTNFDLLQTPRYLRPLALRYPQMFLVENAQDQYAITMLERYCQYDLSPTGAVIMDAHYALFVWSGKTCNAALRVTAIKIARRFSKCFSDLPVMI